MTEEIGVRMDMIFASSYPGILTIKLVGYEGSNKFKVILTDPNGRRDVWFTDGEPHNWNCCVKCVQWRNRTNLVKIILRRWIHRFRRRKAAARIIQAAFREAYYNPSYALCRRVLERSYNSFNQRC